jgi:hypothetical protein
LGSNRRVRVDRFGRVGREVVDLRDPEVRVGVTAASTGAASTGASTAASTGVDAATPASTEGGTVAAAAVAGSVSTGGGSDGVGSGASSDVVDVVASPGGGVSGSPPRTPWTIAITTIASSTIAPRILAPLRRRSAAAGSTGGAAL